MPSGAASAHTDGDRLPGRRARAAARSCATSDPPVASIGSITITGRPASDSGSLLTYGLGWNVSSSRLIPMNPTSASGSSSWAACTKPRPARRIGTTTGCTARRRAGAVGERRLDRAVDRRQVLASPRRAAGADPLEVLAEQRVRRVATSRMRARASATTRMVDDGDGDGHGSMRQVTAPRARSARAAGRSAA